MSWKKHFQSNSGKNFQKLSATYANDHSTAPQPNSHSNRFSSWLPEVYGGSPNRIERYFQYDNMNLDVEVNMALDTITDSCTQQDDSTGMAFQFEWDEGVTEEEVTILQTMLRQWTAINEFDKRLWRAFRSILMYGDQFFIRDQETYKLFWVDQSKVDSVVVNEGKGKKPEEYIMRDLDMNLQTLVASGNLKRPADQRGYSSGPLSSGQFPGGSYNSTAKQVGSRFASNQNGPGATAGLEYHVHADNVVHFSLSEGLDNLWPFGTSILENVFKTFKQKELLEDSLVIYRVQRAPERRIFYIDTGRLPVHKAMAYLERVKNEIQQKRIPSKTGGISNIIDATYNPMSMLEDFFFAQNAEGKGSRVDTLPGGENLGEIDDLKYFHHKMRAGLRVPRSYMPDLDDGGGAVFNDGRIGTAYIEELRFTKYCIRLQNLISPKFDEEFKVFCKQRGINVHASLFKLKFTEPQNFSKYRQTEVDGAVIGVYSQVAGIGHISRRFAMEKWLGLTPDEILKNETMWAEENADKLSIAGAAGGLSGDEDMGFGDVGASAGGLGIGDDLEGEEGDEEDLDLGGDESPITGDEQARADEDNEAEGEEG